MDYSCLEVRSQMLQRTVCSFFYAFGVNEKVGESKAGIGLQYYELS